MKKFSSGSSSSAAFLTRLAGYSATATGALLAAPALHAQSAITSIHLFGSSTNLATGSETSFGAIAHNGQIKFSAATASGADVFRGTLKEAFQSTHYGNRINVQIAAGRLLGNGVMGNGNSPSNVGLGGVVGPGNIFYGSAQIIAGHRGSLFGSSFNSGNFLPTHGAPGAKASGYMGLKTANGNYGWLKVSVVNGGNGFPAEIEFLRATDGVFGAIGPGSVMAGEISAVPEPSMMAAGLGLLAFGAVGVRNCAAAGVWARKRWAKPVGVEHLSLGGDGPSPPTLPELIPRPRAEPQWLVRHLGDAKKRQILTSMAGLCFAGSPAILNVFNLISG